MYAGALVALLLVVGSQRRFVDTASIAAPDHDNFQSNVHLNPWNMNQQTNAQAIPDQIVNQLKNLKPSGNHLDVSYQNSRSEVFTNVNGQKESNVDTKEEVSSNGKKVQSVHLVGHAKDVSDSPTPATHIHAEVEIPERGVHRTFDINSQQQSKRKDFMPRREMDENNVDPNYRSYSGVQYSPLDMAEYVFWTGDEKGVTLAIEEFLQDGLMTREEAISFLQDIKLNLDYLQTHYNEERFQKQQLAKERANQLQKMLSLDKMAEQESKLLVPSELSEVRQQMQESMNKKSMDVEDPSMTHGRMSSVSRPNSLGLSDDDYEDLLERLRMADFLYTEYSLEEIIYQLAKVMFSQSLTRGSSEAQEALQKFTGFLEAEAAQGRISRSLEKKVLDVLIASLTDTLSEHPELVGAARAGLGSGAGSDSALQQLLLLNQEKSGSDGNKYSAKNHRFQSEQTNLPGSPAVAGTAMKKSLPPAKPQTTP